MNILKSEEDIYGKHSQEELHKATKDFFIVSRSIKNKLEDKSYKLDQYLSAVLKIANCMMWQKMDANFLVVLEDYAWVY